jgi:alpha-galactosidase
LGAFDGHEKQTNLYSKVNFQACVAGGGRADLGAMRFSYTFWPSDDVDSLCRLCAQWNFPSFLPVNTMTFHVTHKGEGFSTKFREDVPLTS